jgi:hypothetical protein
MPILRIRIPNTGREFTGSPTLVESLPCAGSEVRHLSGWCALRKTGQNFSLDSSATERNINK